MKLGLSVKEAAREVGVTVHQIRTMISKGTLEADRSTYRTMISRRALEQAFAPAPALDMDALRAAIREEVRRGIAEGFALVAKAMGK